MAIKLDLKGGCAEMFGGSAGASSATIVTSSGDSGEGTQLSPVDSQVRFAVSSGWRNCGDCVVGKDGKDMRGIGLQNRTCVPV